MSVDREREFALFCTIDGYPFPIAVVTDEVAAVEVFRQHVQDCGDHHIPHIHMEPMRRGPDGRSCVPTDIADLGPNLFRAPAEVAS